MSFCKECGIKNVENSSFCGNCGARTGSGIVPSNHETLIDESNSSKPLENSQENLSNVDAQEVCSENNAEETFVGKKYPYYKKKWINMAKSKSAKSWNWPAFFIFPLWAGYRKMYLEAFLYLIFIILINSIPLMAKSNAVILAASLFALAVVVIVAMYANNIYKNHVAKKIYEIKQFYPASRAKHELAKQGGTSIASLIAIWIIWTIVNFAFVFLLSTNADAYTSEADSGTFYPQDRSVSSADESIAQQKNATERLSNDKAESDAAREANEAVEAAIEATRAAEQADAENIIQENRTALEIENRETAAKVAEHERLLAEAEAAKARKEALQAERELLIEQRRQAEQAAVEASKASCPYTIANPMKCYSHDRQPTACAWDYAACGMPRLIKQESKTTCNGKMTAEQATGRIVVVDGCRGLFVPEF